MTGPTDLELMLNAILRKHAQPFVDVDTLKKDIEEYAAALSSSDSAARAEVSDESLNRLVESIMHVFNSKLSNPWDEHFGIKAIVQDFMRSQYTRSETKDAQATVVKIPKGLAYCDDIGSNKTPHDHWVSGFNDCLDQIRNNPANKGIKFEESGE